MISIVMVFRLVSEEVHELWAITQKCINDILVTADTDYELIIIDNGSHDSKYIDSLKRTHVLWGEHHRFIQGTRLFRCDEHVTLSKAWNTGINQADGEYIMLANNDIYFHSPWMTRMIEPFQWPNRKIGICGIQHMSWRFFSFTEGSLCVLPASFREEFDLRKTDELYKDKPYPVVMDERFMYICDVDLNHRVQLAGYECIQVNNPPMQPKYLQHLGHSTINTLAFREDYLKNAHQDRIDLCNKWGFEPVIED